MEEETLVIFRFWDNDVIAIFPEKLGGLGYYLSVTGYWPEHFLGIRKNKLLDMYDEKRKDEKKFANFHNCN